MKFFSPFRPLLKGWLLSFAGWGMVSLVLGLQFLANTGAPWTDAARSAIRDQLPWAFLTPILFRLVTRFPLDWKNWRRALPLHVVSCAIVIWAIHLWKGRVDPDFAEGPPPASPTINVASGKWMPPSDHHPVDRNG